METVHVSCCTNDTQSLTNHIGLHIVVIAAVVFIGWCFAEAGWLIAQKQKEDHVEIKATYTPELSNRGSKLSPITCPGCYMISRNRNTLRYRGSYLNDKHKEYIFIESLHDFIFVIATIVIAVSWVTIFSLILHGRAQRNMNQGFHAIVMAHFNPHQTFINSRRQG
ncbi:uncharacterized protein LOC132718764 [Ruditapes philippinarum]|uniref:uncharacterized protein LOC132718764 n=1 Tax=Ruditapes philippinarum TaxID=129788 RepID=UPI00295B3723|nr:uncharacterized protein LOC132718764 [Ruditapes philippinarum]